MKKKLLLFITSFIGLVAFSQEEEIQTFKFRKAEISFDVSQLFIQTFKVGAEFRVKEDKTIALFAGIQYEDIDDSYEFGYVAEAQYRTYLLITAWDMAYKSKNSQMLGGLYLAPFAQYKYLDKEYDEWIWDNGNDRTVQKQSEFTMLSAGATFGYKLLLANKFTFDLNFAGGLRYSFIEGDEPENVGVIDPGYKGIFPKLQFTLGMQL